MDTGDSGAGSMAHGHKKLIAKLYREVLKCQEETEQGRQEKAL